MRLTQEGVAAINATTRDCLQALEDHDPDAYLKHCTTDLVFMSPGAPTIVGSQAARAFLDGFPTPKSVAHQYDEVEGSGDLAFARGTFTLTDQNDVSATLRAMLIFRRDPGGTWKLARDIWLADQDNEACPEVADPSSAAGTTRYVLTQVYETEAGIADLFARGSEKWKESARSNARMEGYTHCTVVRSTQVIHALSQFSPEESVYALDPHQSANGAQYRFDAGARPN